MAQQQLSTRQAWDQHFPLVWRQQMINTGTNRVNVHSALKGIPISFPITLVAVGNDGKSGAVYRQEKDGTEIALCTGQEGPIAYPVHLFLAGHGSPDHVLLADLQKGVGPTNYR